MANQVLSRPMFKQSQTANPVAPTVGGIGGMTTPDQNAQALKNMFAPQVPLSRPAQSFPVPEAGYKRGGEVIDGVAHFAEGDEVVVPPPAAAPAAPAEAPRSRFYEDFLGGPSSVLSTTQNTRKTYAEREKDAPKKPGIVDYFTMSSPEYEERKRKAEEYSAETLRKVQEDKRLRDAAQSVVRGQEVPTGTYDEITNPYMTPGELSTLDKSVGAMPPAQIEAIRSGKPYTPPAEPPKPPSSLELQLQSIKDRREQSEASAAARREESIKQREENKWMGILSAGLGIMGGTNRNAFANIGAGGQQGLATFATLEKGRREDEAARRQEGYQQQTLALQTQQLAQQKEIAFAQLAKDPDAVRTYAALGGWKAGDPPEKYQEAALAGYEKAHAAERIKALRDYIDKATMTGANPEDVKRANAELLRLGLNSGAGTSSGSQFKLLGAKP